MSGAKFSNADTGTKPSDPYKAKATEDVSLKDKVGDLNAFIEKNKFGMMTTRQGASGLLVSRCMALTGTEQGLDLLFHTNTESGKTDDLASDSHVNIAFLNQSGEWASVSGEASILTDRETVKKYYSKALKAWVGDLGDGKHDGGPDDPRIGLIKVKAVTVTYSLTLGTAVGRTLEIGKSALTGNVPDVNTLREISADEVQTWRQSEKMVS